MSTDLPRSEPSTPKTAAGSPAQRNGTTAGAIRSRELFGAGRQLLIEHSGHVYLLRITQNNKLILTK